MRDGHIHSPYCPHGTSDSLKSYIENSIRAGFKSMTFTEHAPLPPSFFDPVPEQDSGMSWKEVEHYLRSIEKLKEDYKRDITISAGFEVDYIRGFEHETEQFLNTFGPELDDSILSVHFIQGNSQWYCIDYSPDMYQKALEDMGGQDVLYHTYFRELTNSVYAELGRYKPKRIGHMTLVKKFQHLFPAPSDWEKSANHFLDIMKAEQLELDYNGAGTQKPHCEETYPPRRIAKRASAMGIPLIYGSDAHKASAIGQGLGSMERHLLTP